jgi:hypothetical protein
MTNVHLISNARSGSSYLFCVLKHYINPSQPRFIMNDDSFDEPFNPTVIRTHHSDRTYTECCQLRIINIKNTNSLVVKNHINHLDQVQSVSQDLLDRFLDIEMYNIALVRRDLFQYVLSLCIADVTNDWIEYNYHHPFEIDPVQFCVRFDYQMNNLMKLINNVHGIKYNEIVCYEDLEGNARIDYSRLDMCYTHISMLQPTNVDEVKRSPSKTDLVLNYNQLFDLCLTLIDNYIINNDCSNIKIENGILVDF